MDSNFFNRLVFGGGLRFYTKTLKGWLPLSERDVARKLVVYEKLQPKGALEAWQTALPELVVKPRTVVGRQTKFMREKGDIPAVIFGGGERYLISVPAQRIRQIMDTEGFTGRDYILKLDGKQFKARPHHVHLHPVTQIPINITFYKVR